LILKGFCYGKVFLKCLLLYGIPYREEKGRQVIPYTLPRQRAKDLLKGFIQIP
jgi:hypothetical protein